MCANNVFTMIKRFFAVCLSLFVLTQAWSVNELKSVDGRLSVEFGLREEGASTGCPFYRVVYDGVEVVSPSPLGVVTNIGDFTQGLTLGKCETRDVNSSYSVRTMKQSHVDYVGREMTVELERDGKPVLAIEFRVSNRDVAFRYRVYPLRDRRVCVVQQEATGFTLPEGTTTFLCPQMRPMTGFARTAPSYETSYALDEPVGKNGWGAGYTFPCLFKEVGAKKEERGKKKSKGDTPSPLWVLISETGTDGGYVGCRLLNDGGSAYRIGFPLPEEQNGMGSTGAAIGLPGTTPWRTITVGNGLQNIVETTVAWDLVEPKYKASREFVYGKGSWSWIIGMDGSCNKEEQRRYIDFSAAMGYQSVLIDAWWDKQIGYEGIEELARYGKERGVGLFLWYNSNGVWNDAPQTPIGKMSDSRVRRAEMAWMQRAGIRGIKVDFFGGDKQGMMQLYEDILSDANDYGLLVIFHGCTLPRGWERMYPNYAASEAVLASENLHFGQGACDAEARNACIHPFIRNTVGSMDFGGSTLNKFYSADNKRGTHRVTSDVYALATAVLFQSAVQHFALAPNNLTDAPAWAIDFMKRVPTTWDEVRFIDGYPGRYVILARRSGDKWFVVGVNAESAPLKKTVSLPMLNAGETLKVYADDASLQGGVETVKLNKKRTVDVVIPQNGGLVIEVSK